MSLLPDGPRDGPADLLRSELEATAALVFDQALPVAWNPARTIPDPMPRG